MPLLHTSFRQGIRGELLKRFADVRGVGVSEIPALDHQHENRFTLGIDPALRAPGAAVAKGSRREHFRHPLWLTDDAPAQPPAVPRSETGVEIARLDGGHLADRF